MKLNNVFFEIVARESSDGELKCKVKFNPEHYIYQSHFPGTPVTPGVCLVQAATEILSQEHGKTFQLRLLKNIKFKKIVKPGDEPCFVFTKITFNEDSQLSANVSIEDEQSQYVKMSLLCDITD